MASVVAKVIIDKSHTEIFVNLIEKVDINDLNDIHATLAKDIFLALLIEQKEKRLKIKQYEKLTMLAFQAVRKKTHIQNLELHGIYLVSKLLQDISER